MRIKKIQISIILAIFLFIVAQNGFPFLKTNGKEIVDSNGQKVLLRGMGLGGWLVPEGYMLRIPGFGSPTSIKNQIQDLIGAEATEQFYDRYIENFITEKDIEQIAAWGFNSIRLPFNYRMLSPEDQPGIYLEEGFQIIDRVLQWCENNQLYLILDMHCAPGGQNSGNISDSDGIEARLWADPANQDRTVEIWQKIAERYANEQWIGGYDLINETARHFGANNGPLRNLYMRITRAIRTVDCNHIVYIEGNWYGTDFSFLTPHWDVNMVYSFHKYWSENTQASIQDYLNIRNQYNIPLWLGEFGENSNSWFYDCVKLMEDNNIGWCWWTHKKVDAITSPLSVQSTSNYQKILDYWNGETAKPSVTFAQNALFEFADNLISEKCELHSDLLLPLFQKYSSSSEPFTQHTIPGVINCVDYDIGYAGIAYSDDDFHKTRWDADQPWNKGWQYRNDGVDIEQTEDTYGSQFNVGWINSGEWLVFTVDVLYSGSYEITLRVASPGSGGRIQLLLDNVKIATVDVPITGGWQNWESVTIQSIDSISDGTHVLKLMFLTGGFNISYVKFNFQGNGIFQGFEKITDYVLMGQNYPNPFNDATHIPLKVDQQTSLKLNVYNINGELVTTLFDGQMMPGLNHILWDSTDGNGETVTSGTYFYRVKVDNESKIKPMILLK